MLCSVELVLHLFYLINTRHYSVMLIVTQKLFNIMVALFMGVTWHVRIGEIVWVIVNLVELRSFQACAWENLKGKHQELKAKKKCKGDWNRFLKINKWLPGKYAVHISMIAFSSGG